MPFSRRRLVQSAMTYSVESTTSDKSVPPARTLGHDDARCARAHSVHQHRFA